VVADLHWVTERYEAVNSTVAQRILGSICMEAGMRHERPMEVEAWCHEQVGEAEVFHPLALALERIFSEPALPSRRQQLLQRELCGHLTEACRDDLREYNKEAKLARASQGNKDISTKQPQQKNDSDKKKNAAGKQQQPTQASLKDDL